MRHNDHSPKNQVNRSMWILWSIAITLFILAAVGWLVFEASAP